jgi:two-component system response regulator YesN
VKSVEELTVWLSKILARFTDCVFNLSEIRHKDVIFQAINYIRHHYTQHISLDEVAKHVHLNASYLSRVFKEEMQTNFVTYVNNLRVETGKKLLLDSSVPLLEVAGMVGFDEQSYFTKVFKKTTGITPGKFRESRGIPLRKVQ